MQNIAKDGLQNALKQIDDNKVAEIKATLLNVDSKELTKVLDLLTHSRVIQVSAEGDTYPVAADAVYKFNQIGLFAMASGGNVETAIVKTMNLGSKDVLLIISNSSESVALLKQIKVA